MNVGLGWWVMKFNLYLMSREVVREERGTFDLPNEHGSHEIRTPDLPAAR